jgi:hypothetical protein
MADNGGGRGGGNASSDRASVDAKFFEGTNGLALGFMDREYDTIRVLFLFFSSENT